MNGEIAAPVSRSNCADLQRVCRRAEIGEHGAVVAGVGGGESGEQVGAVALHPPVEGSAVDDHAADRGAVAADVLRGRVDHDVGAVGEAG